MADYEGEKPSEARRSLSRDGDSTAAHSQQDPNQTDDVVGQPFTGAFFDKDKDASKARLVYIKTHLIGLTLISMVIFALLSIFWGALWQVQSHVHNLKGWVVDFDGSLMGQTVTQALTAINQKHLMSWEVRPASDFPNGPSDVATAVVQEHCWAAVTINPSSTAKLNQSVVTANPSYNGSQAITAYVNEARQENGYRSLIRPNIDGSLQSITQAFAVESAKQLATQTNLNTLLSNSPQTITQPMYYIIYNLRPFDEPVASAITFVGLIYLLIISFMVTSIGYSARLRTGLNRRLRLGSLIGLRLTTCIVMYFPLSCMYSILSLAFRLPFNRTFGPSGFVIYWMLSWFAMTALGLALESLITILTPKFIPFFLIIWIIGNVSVCVLPIETLPGIYRYGLAMPFYNVSVAVRAIVFGTKNKLGLNFGVLLVWIAISCITLPLLQWFIRRRDVNQLKKQHNEDNTSI